VINQLIGPIIARPHEARIDSAQAEQDVSVWDAASVQDVLSTAIEMHRTGRLGPAAQLYQQILTADQENADALHLLGVLRHQQADHDQAVQLICKAISLRPGEAAFHANLAEAYRAQGQLDRAAGCCRTALRLQPNFPEATVHLGLALRDQGKTEAAVAQFEAALRLRPKFAAAHNNLGDALRVLGRRQQAIDHFRQAVVCEPDFAAARSNLGQILLEQQELEEALVHCREAVRLQPDRAEIHNNLGNVFRARDQLTEAKACYAEALRLNSELGLTYSNMGQALQDEGKPAEAKVWYEQALQLEPNSARIHCCLASVYEGQENYDEAVARYELALRHDPNYAEAHNRLGWVRYEQGRLTEAHQHYKVALQLQPDFPAARCNVGQVLQELGDLAASETAFRDVLRDYPLHAAALTQLAILLRGKLPQADRILIRQRLADPDLTDAGRANLLFGLAHVCDAEGDYQQASAQLQQANALTLTLRNNHNQAYDPALHAHFVEQLVAAFTPAFFERMRGSGLETERPVFIVGLPRSGTTLTEQILASHSQVFGAGELRLAREDFMSLGTEATETSAFEGLARLERDTVQRIGRRHLEQLQVLNATAARVVDKMPDNYMYLGLLAVLFPGAKFIHCRRDLRDVAVSCWMTHFRSIPWANDGDHIAERFELYRRLMEYWQKLLPVSVLEVDYEETVANLEGVARRLVGWCGLDWEPACLAFHESKRPVRTASVTQVRQPLYRHAVGRWKNYENALAPLLHRLQEPAAETAAQ
jgi:tetratricopeptide (TPR) repeat protein